jgi:alpha-mannosidase
LDGKAAVSKPTLKVDNRKLENKFVRVEFDEQGLISRILHKGANHDGSNREVLAPGKKANVFQFFDDQPLGWDAWDIEAYYHETGEDITNLESMEVVERGPVRAAIKLVRSFSNSRITQYVRLTSESPQIEFYTEIDWKEETKLLKVAFPVDINSPRATYEIQYGFAERPTHQNTSWDIARFEVCAHKWADLSEADYGVALLNDCKYGHDIFGGVMRLTLLRAPVAPDDLCDRGHHVLTYALLPHVGDLRQGKVIEKAYALNAPAHAMEVKPSAGQLPTCQSFFSVNKPGVIIEAVKKAEDEEALIIRLYDAHNSRGPCKLTTTLKASKAYLCDMLEDNLEELLVTDGAVDLYFNPFEIVTVKLYLK